MPKPSPDELRKNDKDGFVQRCIPAVRGEGADHKHASGKCIGMWTTAKKHHMELELGLTESVELEATRRGFRKDVIHAGSFVHPSNGRHFTMTRERLSGLEANVHKMIQNGANIPIYHGHDTTKPLGSIKNAMLVGDDLMLDHEFADDDAVTLAKRAKYVSIKTSPNYKDCNDNEYGEVIEHVAITAEPVITGQGEFLQLSRETEADETTTKTEENPMLDKVRGKLGLSGDADEATVLSRIDELAKQAPLQLDREVVGIIAETLDARLEHLVKTSKISPASSTALKLALVGAEGKENVLCLSAKAAGHERSIANQVLDIFEANEVVDTSEQTGEQTPEGSMTLSRKESGAADQKADEQKMIDKMVGTIQPEG